MNLGVIRQIIEYALNFFSWMQRLMSMFLRIGVVIFFDIGLEIRYWCYYSNRELNNSRQKKPIFEVQTSITRGEKLLSLLTWILLENLLNTQFENDVPNTNLP